MPGPRTSLLIHRPSALVIRWDARRAGRVGGFLTPATALGGTLRARLHEEGILFEHEHPTFADLI